MILGTIQHQLSSFKIFSKDPDFWIHSDLIFALQQLENVTVIKKGETLNENQIRLESSNH
jgi:hypothetical protein